MLEQQLSMRVLSGVKRMAFEKPYVFEDVPRTAGGRPLMPSAMANRLRDTLRAGAGAIVLTLLALLWLSLISWSVQDPSLTHATARSARNWLGMPGAVVSDFAIQVFGVAVLAVLLAPMFWALAALWREPVTCFGRRLATYLLSIPMLSAAAASIAAPAAWPVYTGLGGITGDVAFRLVSAPAMIASATLGRPLTGVLLAALGLICVAVSLGWTGNGGFEARTVRARSRTASVTGAVSEALGHRVEPVLTTRAAQASQTSWIKTATANITAKTATAKTATAKTASAPVSPRQKDRFGPYASTAFEPFDDSLDDEIDARTAAVSRGIAERFAPASARDLPLEGPPSGPAWQNELDHTNAPHIMQDALHDAFGGPGHMPPYAHEAPPESVFEPVAGPAPKTATAVTRTPGYKRPSLNLLQRPIGGRSKVAHTESMLRGNARLLEDAFADFGVICEIRSIVPGPVVTIYEMEMAPGINPARVISLSSDIARSVGTSCLRITPVMGRSALAVEMPNQVREPVLLRDIFDADAYRNTMDVLPVALGRNVEGRPIVADLARTPHILVAGAPGSGKTTGLNAMILSLLYKHGPDDCRFLLIDPKMLDLAAYNGIPHLLTPVVSDPHKAITALSWCVTEMEERYKRMGALGVRNIDVFNNRIRNARKRGERLARTVQTGFDSRTGEAMYVQEDMNLEPMPYIVIVIDEFASLMAVAGNEIEGAVQRLAAAAKQVGIHLIMATERPSADIVTAPLRGNLAARVSYKTASKFDSRTLVGGEGAEQLLGEGDMLYANGTGQVQRIQGPYVSQEEVVSITGALRQQGHPRYVSELTGLAPYAPPPETPVTTSRTSVAPGSTDALFDRAVAMIMRDRLASSAHLQRRLNISPAWAVQLIGRLQAEGIIGPPGENGQHPIRIGAAA